MGVRTLLQLSNEKVDKVMEETAQVSGGRAGMGVAKSS